MKNIEIEIPKGMMLDKVKYAKNIIAFLPINIIDYKTIKTYEDAVKVRSIDDDDIIYETDRPHIVAYKKICHIVKTINNGWTPDWSNDKQHKYNPYFKVSSSGSDFSVSSCVYDCASVHVGSRLLTNSSEKALYLAEQFQDLYVQYLLIAK